MKRIDFGDDKTFIENYERLKSSRKMGELYGCDKKTVTSHAKKIGYDYSKFKVRKITSIPIEEVIIAYEELQNLDKVGERYDCSGTAVGNYLKKNGYKLHNSQAKLGKVTPEEFIATYRELKNTDKVSEKYGCSSTAIREYAKKIGYDINEVKEYKLSEEDKQYILNSYYTKTSNELADELNVSRGMITKLWFDNGLQGKEVSDWKTTEIDLTGQRFGRWTVLSKSNKRNAGGAIYWHCRCDCGVEKDVLGTSLRQGTSLSCGAHSNISKGNEKIKSILTEANIPFEIEVKYPTCKDIKELPFDFRVDDRYLIEYDGIQHFQPTMFDYEYTHNHDIIKSQWCKENHIPLIRIPYYHFDNLCLEDLLLETSRFVEK